MTEPGEQATQAAGAKKRFWINASWLLSERVMRTLVGFVVSTAVARHLGPGELGVLSLAQSLVFVAAGLSALGLDSVLVPELVRDPGARDRLLGTAFALRACAALLAGSVIFGLSYVGDYAAPTSALVAILALANVLDALGVVDQYFVASIQAGSAVRLRLLTFLVSSGLRLAMVFADADLYSFAWIQVAGSLLQAIGYAITYRGVGLSLLNWRFNTGDARRLIKLCWPLAAAGLVLHTQARVDQILMGSLLPPEILGSYSVAVRLTETLGVLPAVISASLAPLVASAHSEGGSIYRQRLIQLHQVMFVSALAIALPMVVLGPWAVRLVYGKGFEMAGGLFAACSVRLMLSHLGSGRHVFLVNEGLSLLSLGNMVIATAVNIVCNLILIPQFGAYGAILAMAISFSSLFVQDCFHARMRFNLRLMGVGVASSWKLRSLMKGVAS
jgi:O-antigen/teichoic acid export membrane protein